MKPAWMLFSFHLSLWAVSKPRRVVIHAGPWGVTSVHPCSRRGRVLSPGVRSVWPVGVTEDALGPLRTRTFSDVSHTSIRLEQTQFRLQDASMFPSAAASSVLLGPQV